MKSLNLLVLGAAIGAVAALLMAPESGEDLRLRIKNILKKKGIIPMDEIDILAARIAQEIEQED